LIFQVKGVPTKGLVDGASYDARLVCVGTYKYGSRTVPSYAIHTPLTKEQFADALAKGFMLADYRTVKYQAQVDVDSEGKPKMGTRVKVVATPIP
jgi:hypothetical protein